MSISGVISKGGNVGNETLVEMAETLDVLFVMVAIASCMGVGWFILWCIVHRCS